MSTGEIQRYDLLGPPISGMHPRDDGEWVRYEDHLAALDSQRLGYELDATERAAPQSNESYIDKLIAEREDARHGEDMWKAKFEGRICPTCESGNRFVPKDPCNRDSHEPDDWHRNRAALQSKPEQGGRHVPKAPGDCRTPEEEAAFELYAAGPWGKFDRFIDDDPPNISTNSHSMALYLEMVEVVKPFLTQHPDLLLDEGDRERLRRIADRIDLTIAEAEWPAELPFGAEALSDADCLRKLADSPSGDVGRLEKAVEETFCDDAACSRCAHIRKALSDFKREAGR